MGSTKKYLFFHLSYTSHLNWQHKQNDLQCLIYLFFFFITDNTKQFLRFTVISFFFISFCIQCVLNTSSRDVPKRIPHDLIRFRLWELQFFDY